MDRINTVSPLDVYEIAAPGTVSSGMIVCFDAAGKLVPGADTAGLTFAGVVVRADQENNVAEIEVGCLAFANAAGGAAVARTHRNRAAFVAGPDSVAAAGNVPAGIVVDVFEEQVFVDCTPAAVAAAAPAPAAEG